MANKLAAINITASCKGVWAAPASTVARGHGRPQQHPAGSQAGAHQLHQLEPSLSSWCMKFSR